METYTPDAQSQIRVRFFREPVQNDAKTLSEGRPIFEEQEMVEVSIPGDRLNRLVALANEPTNNRGGNTGTTYAERYPREYDAFKRGEAVATAGTPLEHWPILTSSRTMELKAIGIMSVDELAASSEDVLKRLGPGGRELREQARAFISNARGGAELAALAKTNADLQARLDRMEAQLLSQQANPALLAESPPAAAEVSIDDATDDQLKAFIKQKTGSAPRGNVSRETLVERVTELAEAA